MKKLTCIFFAIFSLLTVLPGFAQDDDGFPLPFLEQWNTGTFGTNNWLPEGENWSINGNEGQPDPCAQFTWVPIQTDYSISLESDQFLADFMTEGRIYLDFDVKLDNVNATGNEQMLVQVWNWESQAWGTVSTYSNIDGSFDWASEHLDITSLAMETVFKIRFLSVGESSLNIVGWFLDNIHVYRECTAPFDLSTYNDINYQEIILKWELHHAVEEWIHWDDGVNSGNSIGVGDTIEFDAAARWVPSQLSAYEGADVEQVAFFPAESQAEYRIRVWIGAGASNMIVDQLVENPIIGQWNVIPLTTPANIDITQALWVGYHVDAQAGWPAGVDDGPAIDGYGNMMNFGGWQTLLEINPELDFNWNIKVFLHQQGYTSNPEFAIYRQDDDGPFFLRAYSDTIYYVDDSVCSEGNWGHNYKVSALYFSEYDTCESELSNESLSFCFPFNIKEQEEDNMLNIYPNPAFDMLFIESSEEKIEFVTVYDGRGERVKRRKGEGVKMELQVNDLAPGLYLVKVETKGEMVVRKVVIRR
jgi:hypothetical protein